jgi:hypothetical protein
MVLSIIFLEDKHKILLHLSIFYEYQQFYSTPYMFLDTAARLLWPVTQISSFQQFFLINGHDLVLLVPCSSLGVSACVYIWCVLIACTVLMLELLADSFLLHDCPPSYIWHCSHACTLVMGRTLVMLYVLLTMPTLNKAYLFIIYLFITYLCLWWE